MSRYLIFAILMTAFSAPSLAQETIFNVPSGAILDKGKIYGEFDFSYLWDASAGTYTPRVVAGIGHRVEVGMNVNGISSPGPSQTTPTPTIKWKAYDGGKNGWVFMLGDDVFIPAQNRSYNAGGQFGIEQPVNKRVTLAADWFTGHHGAGYFTPGAATKLSSKATAYT